MGKLYSALILLSLIWGTSFLFMKILLFDLDPTAVVFGRCLFGTIMLFIIVLLSKEKFHLKKLPWHKLFFVALFNNALPWLLICSSETKISSGLASGINATTPVWTLIIGFFFFTSSLKKKQWVGIIIGFLGIFVLSGIKVTEIFSGNTLGVLLMSGAALCYGIGAQLSKRDLSELSVLQISFFTLALSTMISFIAMMSIAPDSVLRFNHLNLLFPFVGLGAFGSGVAYLLYYYLVKMGSPELASLVTYIVPVSAIGWGALILKESIHSTMIIGLIIILAGVYISSKSTNTPAKTEAAA
jgi:drug/metabolite transporter (DMT)-like permease